MELARDMYGSWPASEIVRCLARNGVSVSESTVKRWADPESAEAKRLAAVERARQRRRNDRVFARIKALRAGGLSHNAVATVLSLDYGCEITEYQVRYSDRKGALSRELCRALFDEFVPGALRTASRMVESRPESTRGEPLEDGRDVRLPTPTPWEVT